MIETIDQISIDRIERQKQRDKNTPICSKVIHSDKSGKVLKTCDTKTHYISKCGGYVCSKCGTHYFQSGSKMRFCFCGWNKSNYSYLDAGEYWDSEY